MGELEAWTRLTTVRRLCGQVSMGPSGVPDQSLVLISLAISPPPINQSSGADNLASLVTRATLRLVGGGVPASPGALSARSEAFQLVARRVFPGGAYRPCPRPWWCAVRLWLSTTFSHSINTLSELIYPSPQPRGSAWCGALHPKSQLETPVSLALLWRVVQDEAGVAQAHQC